MIDREKVHRRVIDKINYGYSTHRVANRILEESLIELANALIDEVEKVEHERSEPTKAVRKHKE